MATTPQVQVQSGKLFINGEWAAAASGEERETINPATGEVIAPLASAGA